MGSNNKNVTNKLIQNSMKKIIFIFLACFALISNGQVSNKLSSSDKIYGLSKLWMEVSYNFVYLDKIGKEKWDSIYYASIPVVLETKNDYQYYKELQKVCATLKDGHTNIFMPFEEGNSNFGNYRIGLINIQNRAIVGAVNLSKKDEIPIGSEVVEVNGSPTRDYIKENVTPYISSSTPQILEDLSIERLLRGVDGESYTVKLKTPTGNAINLNLTHGKVTEKETYPVINRPNLFEFKWLDNNIAYIALNSFANPKIDTLFLQKLPELYKAKGLIIDLRNNGGGSGYVGFNIFKYLTNDSLILGGKALTRDNISAFKAWGGMYQPKDTSIGDPKRARSRKEVRSYYLSSKDQNYYYFKNEPFKNDVAASKVIVPTVVLFGHSTASAAEDFLVFAKGQKHFTKIGENTFGSTGQPYEFKLPGGGIARVCTLKVTYADGDEFVGNGIAPDIEVKATLDDYLQKRDPVLDKGLEFLKTKISK